MSFFIFFKVKKVKLLKGTAQNPNYHSGAPLNVLLLNGADQLAAVIEALALGRVCTAMDEG